MKQGRVVSLVVLMLLLGAFGTVQAQSDAAHKATFPDGVTVAYPDDWYVGYDNDEVMRLESDTTGLYVFMYGLDFMADEGFEPGDVLGMLEYYYNYNASGESDPFDASRLQTVTINEREITYFEPLVVENGEQYRVLRGAMQLDEAGRVLTFGAFPFEGDTMTETDTVLEIIASAETGVYYLSDGSFFTYPPDWNGYLDEDGYIHLYSTTINARLEFFSPEELAEKQATADNLTPVLIKAFGAANDPSLVFDSALMTTFTAGEHPAVSYLFTDSYEGQPYERWLLVMLSADGWANLFDIVPFADTISEDDQAAALDMLASFQLPAE